MAEKKNEFIQRKQDHIQLALDQKTQSVTASGFDQIRLKHEAFPQISFSQISIQSRLLGQSFSSPHFVSSMTAGHEKGLQINRHLALAAGEVGWAMAVGSQKRELIDSSFSDEWVKIKAVAKKTKFISNIGIEEIVLNPAEFIYKMIERLDSIGIYVHLNSLQETFQKKDDVHFADSAKKLKKFIRNCPVPVLVKEVGFGINYETAQRLFSLGVDVVDVAGKGGTHWGIIEGLRLGESHYQSSLAFKDWGYSTVEALKMSRKLMAKNKIWASGGVRSGVDSAKCLALGAQAVGVAQPLLKAAIESEQAVLNVMNQFDFELKAALFGVGVIDLKQLQAKKVFYEAK